ncbi:transcriptional regulator [Duganella sp. Leaf126]|uniref:MarR family winged helix-turn-helix transcriptional regulator n=1 Tax=Duganella sp. Leaf126 TaxID=1736266 RepID=UPI000701CA0C|nr:MarR family winged helix-turn-helix transcriptional regulator [Duganella sp. Leaf126]KQQ32818.1 transcriptional regulator [Duganella sp. Leaf126]
MQNDIHPEAAVAPGYLANHAARVFNRTVDAELRTHGLTLALIGPLLLLSWKGPMLQRDLVRASAVKQPAMVALLDKLEASALIERAALSTDKRAATVRLTDAGRAAATIGHDVLLQMNAVGTTGFSAQEAALLVGLLGRLITNLEHGTP